MPTLFKLYIQISYTYTLKSSISSYSFSGAEEVISRLTVMKERHEQAAADERLIKSAVKREAEEKTKKPSILPYPREWPQKSCTVISKSLLRYPAGFQNRWQMITYYINDQLDPVDLYTLEDCLVAAHKLYLTAQANVLPTSSEDA